MQIVNISEEEFMNLEKYVLPKSIINREGVLYVLPRKEQMLLKRFFLTNGRPLNNKLYTLGELIENKDIIDIEELVMPDALASVGEKIIGYTMPLIDSINLSSALNTMSIDLPTKLEYLKQIGTILRKMAEVRNTTKVKDFYLNDLHENNFVIRRSDKKVFCVDLDSCSIGGNIPFGTKYLSKMYPISEVPTKYNGELLTSAGGEIVPSENTDLYCYNIIILNFIFNGYVPHLKINEYYDYLEYLISIGANKELIDIFAKLYQLEDNENPDYLLDSIPEFITKANSVSFARTRTKN
ncbi:MAG: hypothetical protein RR478_01995 [Bacilli bacterium]